MVGPEKSHTAFYLGARLLNNYNNFAGFNSCYI